MKKLLVLGFLFVLVASLVAVAQENTQPSSTTSHVSKYVWVSSGSMNPGKGKVYTNLVREIRDSANANNVDFYWLAGYNITGNDRGVSFVSFHDTMQSVDKAIDTMDKVMRAAAMKNTNLSTESAESEALESHSVLAKYREDLSYRPELVDAAHTTRWSVTTFQLKPGTSSEFGELAKEYAELVKKTNDPNEHWIAYQVIAGAPSPTFMIVSPMKSLADMDQENEAAMKAVFTEPIMRHFSATEQKIVNSAETQLLQVAPELSRPPQSMIAANPSFWTIKDDGTALATNTKMKKAKKAPVEPAAVREETKK